MRSTKNHTLWLRLLTSALLLIAIMQPALAHGQLTELYAFQYNAASTSNFPDGENPMAELIQGVDGNYYTTTNTGGAGTCPGEVEGQIPGCGAVVKITPAGALSVLYSFPYDSSTSSAPDGWVWIGVAALMLVAVCGNAQNANAEKLAQLRSHTQAASPDATFTCTYPFTTGSGATFSPGTSKHV